MDKSVQQQQSNSLQQQNQQQQQSTQKLNSQRSHRKLVRSTDQSWFGDIRLSPTSTPGASDNESATIPSTTDKTVSHDVAHQSKKSCSRSNQTTDNKTIRRLEFFTSLQKQLMNSIGRRSGSHESSSASMSGCSSSGIKRNASCRYHKGDKVDKQAKSDIKATMPSSYSAASLVKHLSPTQPTPQVSLSGKIETSLLDQQSNNVNGSNTRLHLSPTEPINVNHHAQQKTNGSPLSDTHILFSNIASQSHRVQNSKNNENNTISNSDVSLSKSVPNTLMLSPTNPFFASLEQHLAEQSKILKNSKEKIHKNSSSTEDEAQKSNSNDNKNPFLYDTINSGIRNSSNSSRSGNNSNDSNNSNSNVRIGFAVMPSSSCSKREEFLKATMKICLVVSPPSNKFQLKSKSLTHLDQLEPQLRAEEEEINISNYKSSKKTDQLSREQSTENDNKQITLVTTSTSTSNPSRPIAIATPIKKKSSSFLHRGVKKPMLTRSQISSSEYFCVWFDTDAGSSERDEVFIPATKGVLLSDSLLPALGHRSLSFSQISIIDNGMHNQFELGIPTYLGPLDGGTDIGSLAGRTLIVTEKDSARRAGHYTLQKAASIGFRSKQNKFFSSASTEEAFDPDSGKVGKQSKQKWSLQLFGVKNPQQNQLCELLNYYTKNGVPQSKSSCSNFNNPEYLEALKGLENIPSSWTEIVTSSGMSETETKIQSAIWELVTTEIDYIHALKTVTDLFLACLEAIQMENILTEVDQNKLFSNIRDICEANLKFWSMYLYPMVKNSIQTGYPMCIDYFQQGFITFSSIFVPYTKYCAEQSTCQFYCKELNQNNALFTAYLAWCESQKMCNRLRLADILVRPMQRLTKYSLLLTAIRKHVADENDGEVMDSMIHSVEDFVCSVNAHLTTRQENERLKGIMARIESYDVVDTNNEHLDKMVKQFSTMFDLCGPMKGCVVAQGRHLFMEGDLKYKDHLNKIDVHCFLLTDMLLICKATAKKGHGTLKIVRQPYQTDRLQIKHKDNTLYCCYLNDYNLVVAAFTLQCTEAKSWHDGITKAKHIYTRLKQGSPWDINYATNTLQVKKSPLNSSIGSRVSSLNNSHSGSIELTESRNVSVDFEKTNSVSSDEGSSYGVNSKTKIVPTGNRKLKQTTSNSLTIQPYTSLGQSMPNLNVHSTHSSDDINENEQKYALGFEETTSTNSV